MEGEFRNYKIIKTIHSKSRMTERKVTNKEIYDTISKGVIYEKNKLLYNNLYLVFITDDEKKLFIIITLIRGNEHPLTKKEKEIILRLNKLIQENNHDNIEKELTSCYNDFNEHKFFFTNFDQFNFSDLLKFSDPFIFDYYDKKKKKIKIIYGHDKLSIIMKVLLSDNLFFLSKLIKDYSINIGIVNKTYSIVLKIIKKFDTKKNYPENHIQIEQSTFNFINSLDFVVNWYKNSGQIEMINQIIKSKSPDGYTPLMLSLYKGLDKLSCFLIHHGANILVEPSNINKKGENIVDLYLMNKDYLIETGKYFPNYNLENIR